MGHDSCCLVHQQLLRLEKKSFFNRTSAGNFKLMSLSLFFRFKDDQLSLVIKWPEKEFTVWIKKYVVMSVDNR